ncbi:MAG: caspase family protein [Pseudomonadota bacterium]
MGPINLSRRALLAGGGAAAGLASCATNPRYTATPFLALIVGNTYDEADGIPTLYNTDRDMQDIGSSLQGTAGWHGQGVSKKDAVRILPNANAADLKSSLQRFAASVETANANAMARAERLSRVGFEMQDVQYPTVFFYFAGHGFQSGKRNYLVPDVKRGEPMTVIDAESLLRSLTNVAKSGVVFVLDACRDQPTETFSRDDVAERAKATLLDGPALQPTRGFDVEFLNVVAQASNAREGEVGLDGNTPGLVGLEGIEGKETWIVYSTASNTSAADNPCSVDGRRGRNGPFAKHLERELRVKQSLGNAITRTIQSMRADYETCREGIVASGRAVSQDFRSQSPYEYKNFSYNPYFAGRPVIEELPDCDRRPWSCVD